MHAVQNRARSTYDSSIEEGFELSLVSKRLKTFPNSMRDDGVFVAEDKEMEPYEGITSLDGAQVFPAIPRGLVFSRQMPQALADRLVACWNAFEGIPTEEIRKRGHARTS